MWDSLRDDLAMARYADGRLTALKVKTLSKPGRYGDGNGLYLVVDQSGARRWMLRTMVQGWRRDMGLGSARLVSLADARRPRLNIVASPATAAILLPYAANAGASL